MKLTSNTTLGALAGVIICIVWFVSAYSLGFYSLLIYSYKFYATLLLLLTGIFISVAVERKANGGFIEFKDGVKNGLLFSIVLGLVVGAFNYLYHQFIATDAVEYFVSEERKAWLAHSRTAEEVNAYLDKYYIPSFGTFHTIMTTLIWGVILSLLAGAILRRKKPEMPFSAN